MAKKIRKISRRDFLNGVAIGAAGLMGRRMARAQVRAESGYPPAKMGLRGSQPGSETVAHALRDGQPLESFGEAVATGETYDLVVVGAGISGLSAAHFFRKAVPGARVLVLDNHDDLGGHSRRNEFSHQGQTWVGYGGAIAIDSPKPYSAVAHALVTELGIDPRKRRAPAVAGAGTLASKRGFFFDRETFGRDALLVDPRGGDRRGVAEESRAAWESFLAAAPMGEGGKRDLRALYRGPADPMTGLSSAEKKRRLARISYAKFLTEHLKLDAEVVKVLQASTHDLYGVGIDAVPAQDAWGLGLPGFQKMALAPGAGPGMNHDAMPGDASYYLHFPDGNATVARLLVRGLIPGALPGSSVDDALAARLDYGALDEGPVRIRLESTVARVRHVARAAKGQEVEVAYVRGGRLATVRAGACVMACWNGVIPYIVPELPEEQKEALSYGVKVPLLYTNVFLRDWKALQALGIRRLSAPGCFHTSLSLSDVYKLDGSRAPGDPREPVIAHLGKTPNQPGLPARDQHRMGRMELLGMPFEEIEGRIRDELQRQLGAGGFDAGRDILGITVNRWAHGYAYQYNSLWDPFWIEGGDAPCVRGRQPHGRIAIANADAGAYAYMDSAIDQAHRAVRELME